MFGCQAVILWPIYTDSGISRESIDSKILRFKELASIIQLSTYL